MKPVDIDETLLVDMYVGQKRTVRACAERLGVSESATRRRLKKLGIEIRPPIRRLIEDITDERVVNLYWDQKLSVAQTAKALGRSERFVKGRLPKSGRGTRSLSESDKIRKGTADITDDQLIYLHDVRDWTCAQISRHLGKSADFVRQRFMAIGKDRRQNVGKYNGAYIDGRTPLRTRIRDCAKSLAWKQACLERDNYTCQHTGQFGGKLEIHHLKPFAQIFEEFLSINSDLDPEKDCDTLFDLAQEYPPFWDVSNGVTIAAEEHTRLHS